MGALPVSPARAREALARNKAWRAEHVRELPVMRDVSAELTQDEIAAVWAWLFARRWPHRYCFTDVVEACARGDLPPDDPENAKKPRRPGGRRG